MDELAEPRYTRRRWLGEIVGLLLTGLSIAIAIYLTGVAPGSIAPSEGLPTILGGTFLVLVGAIWIASYFLPAWSVVFRVLAWCAENLPGTMGGRIGLLLVGGLFALLGLALISVGFGVFG